MIPRNEIPRNDASMLPALRRPALRGAVASLCAIALVHVQWYSAWRDGQWLAQAHAQAAVNSTLAVLVVPQTKKVADEAEAIERLLDDAVLRMDTVRLFELSPIAGGDASVKAGDLVEEALRALLLRTPKRAQERLATAVQVLGEAPMAGDERLFARTWKAQALAWLAGNELVKARDAMQKSLVLMPNQTRAEYAAYGSSARELFDSVKPSIASLPTGDIRVSAKSTRGDIWVDGVLRGSSAATVGDVPIGTHRVTVRASGYAGERRFVEVSANKGITADVELKSAPFGPELEQGRSVLTANFTQPSVVEDRMRELRNQLGSDQMLVVRPKLSKKTTELSGYFLGADGTFKKVDISIAKDETYLDKLAEFVATTVGSKLQPDPATQPLDLRQSVVVSGTGPTASAAAGAYIDPNAPLFEDVDKDKKVPLTRKWWFWTAVVGGAGLLGGGLYLLSKSTPDVRQGATGDLKLNLHYLHNQ